MKYLDAHAHLASDFFNANVEQTIKEAQKMGVKKIIVPGTTSADSFLSIEIAKQFKGVYASVGIHPSNAHADDLNYLNEVNPAQIVAIGEVGIDLYRKENPPLLIQAKVLKRHIEFALLHDKPMIIHMRHAEQEVYDILKNYPKLKFLMHSYTGSWEWAEKFLAIGAFISFSGIVTFKNAKDLQGVAKMTPQNKIITETDSPFLTPTPFRGKVSNSPKMVIHIVKYLQQLRNEENLDTIIYKNALSFFKL